jgi:hypothetical protein
MQTKLTLRLDEELIERAKAYSRRTGKSVSQLVADFLQMLPGQPRGRATTPIVSSLRGVLRGAEMDEEDFRRHLEERHL